MDVHHFLSSPTTTPLIPVALPGCSSGPQPNGKHAFMYLARSQPLSGGVLLTSSSIPYFGSWMARIVVSTAASGLAVLTNANTVTCEPNFRHCVLSF